MNKKSCQRHTGNFLQPNFTRCTSLNKQFKFNQTEINPFEKVAYCNSSQIRLDHMPLQKHKQLNRYGSHQDLIRLPSHIQHHKQFKNNRQKYGIQADSYINKQRISPIKQKQKTTQTFGIRSFLRNRAQVNGKQLLNRQIQDRINKQDLQIAKKLQETSASNSSSQKKLSNYKQMPLFFKLKRNSQDYKINNTSINDLIKIKKLGQGKFGQVFLVLEKNTNFIMAMKVFKKSKLVQADFLEQFIRQLKVQAYLNHPNIIKLYGFFHEQDYIYVLLENACDGQLYKVLEEKKTLSEGTTSYIIKSLLQGVKHMHQQKILHRDIKPENIVLSYGTVKICDFGWAVHTKSELRSTYCGTPLYFSPELLKGKLYDQKVDVWAIGVMAFQLHLGKYPFDISQQSDLYKIVTDSVRCPIKATSKKFREFIAAILQKNPLQRLLSQELLDLPFITHYKDLQIYEQLL